MSDRNVNFVCWPALPYPADPVHDLIVEELRAAGVPVDTPNPEGDTLLHVASRNGASTTVRALLTVGASVNTRNHAGQTPFDSACGSAHDDVTRLLCDAGGQPGSELKLQDITRRIA